MRKGEVRVRCLDEDETCSGEVAYRMALSGSGRSYPRCETHWQQRLRKQARIDRTYPDTPTPPSWFDPAAAGERWNEDD